jgi:hypothetical protein
MAKESTTGRKPVTSDPDRGVPVNSGTDPQRPGTPPVPVPETAAPGTSAEEAATTTDRFNATHEPAPAGRGEDVEGAASKDEPDDPL